MTSAVVVGAGVFGASTARELDRRGWDVTLVEQYTPGHVRSGSGGDTRLLRFSHGEVEWYSLLARRALELWRELEAEAGLRLFEPVGVAWFDTGVSDFTQRSEETLRRLGIPCERLTPEEARRLYPSLGGDDLRSVLFEPEAGVLYARLATRALASGLPLRAGRATPADPPAADVVVWACGAWLPGSFPSLVRQRISRRDVFFVGVDAAWAARARLLRIRRAATTATASSAARDEDLARRRRAARSTPTCLSGCRIPARRHSPASTRRGGSRRSPARRSSARVSASTT